MGQMVQTKKAAVAVKVDAAPAQYLTFSLGGEMFAVGILHVKEIGRREGIEISATVRADG